MFVNAFLVIPGMMPGQFPSGGPVHRLIDVYHAAAPAIDVLSPNAYSADFKALCALYARGGNPLLIPETGPQAGNLFWAVGHHAALAWSPFGMVETLKPGGQLSRAYEALKSVMPMLTAWQAEGKVDGNTGGRRRRVEAPVHGRLRHQPGSAGQLAVRSHGAGSRGCVRAAPAAVHRERHSAIRDRSPPGPGRVSVGRSQWGPEVRGGFPRPVECRDIEQR